MNRDQPTRRQLMQGLFGGLLGMGLAGDKQPTRATEPCGIEWKHVEMGNVTTYFYDADDRAGCSLQYVYCYDGDGRLISREIG